MSEATELKYDDLGKLKLLLQPVATHWVAIADQLDMTSCVATIQSKHGIADSPGFLRELLYRWLNRGSRATVEALCQALREDDEIIGGAAVADQLERKFCPDRRGLKRKYQDNTRFL